MASFHAAPEARPQRMLAALLDCLGVPQRSDERAERLELGTDVFPFARALERHGLPARVVRLGPDALGTLSLPTLIGMKAGPPLLLLEHGISGSVVVEDGNGARRTLRAAELRERWSGLAIERQSAYPTAQRLVPLLRETMRAHAREVLKVVLVALLGACLTPLMPWLTRLAMDRALPQGAPRMLVALSCVLVLVSVHQAWVGFLRRRVQRRALALISRSAIEGTFVMLTGGRYESLVRHSVGALLQTLSCVDAAAGSLVLLATSPLFDLSAALVALVLVFVVAPVHGFALLALSVPIAAGVTWAAYRQAQVQVREIEAAGEQRATLQALLAGVRTVKALGCEQHAVKDWLGRMIDERRATLMRERLGVGSAAALEVQQRLAGAIAFGVGGHACLHAQLSVGDVLMLSAMSGMFVRAVQSIALLAGPAFGLRAYARQVDPVLTGCAPEEPVPAQRISGAADAIVLEDVWFRYGPDEPWILEGYNLRIARGDAVYLQGASGSGKTTVLRLIAGLYKPQRGVVSVFGYDPAALRVELAYVPQNAYLFEGSVLYNLEVFSRASRQAILAAAERTGLAGWLATLPMQFETALTPGGGNVSGGERQWIVLTAAVAANPELVLLDESLSQIDRILRQQLDLTGLFEGRTVISVAHDA
jgi:ATP-binding cassette subfamily B protein